MSPSALGSPHEGSVCEDRESVFTDIAGWGDGGDVEPQTPSKRRTAAHGSESAALAATEQALGSDSGLVEVSFNQGEAPLGLIFDWCMALPVLVGVTPDSSAANKYSLVPNLVLIRMNQRMLQPGVSREEVECLLTARPLLLVFEMSNVRTRLLGCPGQTDELSSSGFRGGGRPLILREPRSSPKPPKSRMSPVAVTLSGQSFFELNPERSPLSRFGSLRGPPPLPLQRSKPRSVSGCLLHGQDLTDLRAMREERRREAPILPQLAAVAQMDPLSLSTWGVSYGTAGTAEKREPRDRMRRSSSTVAAFYGGSSSSSSRHASSSVASAASASTTASGSCSGLSSSFSAPSFGSLRANDYYPDSCYQTVVERPRPIGPGPPAGWPLDHEPGYICRLSDLALAGRVRDGYEVGFRATKREPPDPLAMEDPSDASFDHRTVPRKREHGRVVEVTCDACGNFLADPDTPGSFWYCRRCRKAGHRFELCVTCHATEVLQAEGKYATSSREPHPHFTRCGHLGLDKRQTKCPYPESSHITVIFCDYCGHSVNPWEDPIYVCLRCPVESGYRFELCELCADAFRKGCGLGMSSGPRPRTNTGIIPTQKPELHLKAESRETLPGIASYRSQEPSRLGTARSLVEKVAGDA